ncbi:hypothetical protein BD410DRAFT_845678 [Rickenella mellea]|uniref:REJ domain-containing protein n=1 Tax=Rickenella mellea TaxID=50990 RepID=A0A4Y7PHY9_9AGAM|nr:hypothetical protein BD410DRAFT_845678 [Rickenella mellea]
MRLTVLALASAFVVLTSAQQSSLPITIEPISPIIPSGTTLPGSILPIPTSGTDSATGSNTLTLPGSSSSSQTSSSSSSSATPTLPPSVSATGTGTGASTSPPSTSSPSPSSGAMEAVHVNFAVAFGAIALGIAGL